MTAPSRGLMKVSFIPFHAVQRLRAGSESPGILCKCEKRCIWPPLIHSVFQRVWWKAQGLPGLPGKSLEGIRHNEARHGRYVDCISISAAYILLHFQQDPLTIVFHPFEQDTL